MGNWFPKSDLMLTEDSNWTAWCPKQQSLSATHVSLKGDSSGTAVTELLLVIALYIATVFLLHIPLCVIGTLTPEKCC